MALSLTGSPPITAAALDSAVNTELSTNWFPLAGTTAGGNASAGNIGEFISSNVAIGSAVSATNAVVLNVTSISLTAGDWDVWGNVATNPAGSTTTSTIAAGINTTSATLPTIPNGGGYAQFNIGSSAGAVNVVPTGTMRLNISTTTTVYLIADVSFAVSTMSLYGFIGARRVR